MHLHPETPPQEARSLRNQVVCMIAEYHLTSSAWVLPTLCLVLPEAAKPLLPALNSYLPGISFEGTRDARVLDHAKTLRVAVWLHWLDMSVGGDQLASETLEALWHSLGHLLKSFLASTTNDLMFLEVIEWVLHENRRDAQHCLGNLVMCHTWIHQELDDFIEAHRGASGPGTDDAPSESTSAPVSTSPPSKNHAMEVDIGAVSSPPTSPVSREDDNLLSANDAVGVEAGLAYLTVLSPSGQDGEGKEASVSEAPSPLVEH